ncbi:MAG: hypothetical protein ACXWVI_03970 [Methyloceanibacter sp.]
MLIWQRRDRIDARAGLHRPCPFFIVALFLVGAIDLALDGASSSATRSASFSKLGDDDLLAWADLAMTLSGECVNLPDATMLHGPEFQARARDTKPHSSVE